MKTEKIIFTVIAEGFAKQFENRDDAKLVYKALKKRCSQATLYKTITKVKTLEFDDSSECWL
jgi:hypothetical protein